MIRNKSLLIFISLLLFGSMTLADTKSLYLEQEELVEGREIEREELKEGVEGRDSIKLLFGGGKDYLNGSIINTIPLVTNFYIQEATQRDAERRKQQIPLFLMYCCIKIHHI